MHNACIERMSLDSHVDKTANAVATREKGCCHANGKENRLGYRAEAQAHLGKHKEEQGDHGDLVEDLDGAVECEACIKVCIEGIGEGEEDGDRSAEHGARVYGEGKDRENQIGYRKESGYDHQNAENSGEGSAHAVFEGGNKADKPNQRREYSEACGEYGGKRGAVFASRKGGTEEHAKDRKSDYSQHI